MLAYGALLHHQQAFLYDDIKSSKFEYYHFNV